MSKIWEVDFTSFSGSTAVAYDNVDSQPMATVTGISKVSPLPGFINRGGITLTKISSAQWYDIQNSPCPNACFRQTYNRRSFAFWFYNPITMNNTSYWDHTYRVIMWGSQANVNYTSDSDNGIQMDSNGGSYTLKGRINANNIVDLGDITGWNFVVICVDRIAVETKFYLNGVLKATTTHLPNSTPGNGEHLGNRFAGNGQGTYSLGYVATYDHALSQDEITAMYNTFLVDSTYGQTAYQTCSGYIYDPGHVPVSGAKLDLIYNASNSLLNSYTTSGDGFYSMILPFSGSYSLLTFKEGVGSQATSVLATSSGVYFT